MDNNSLKLMQYFIDEYLLGFNAATVLDVGSRRIDKRSQQMETYRDLFDDRFKYTGMDIEPGENVDIVGYKDLGIYDIVISGQVMEHVNRPWEWLKNLTTYAREYICIIAPHTFKEHRFPLDTYRFMPDGMRDLFDYADIKELEIIKGRNLTMGIGQI